MSPPDIQNLIHQLRITLGKMEIALAHTIDAIVLIDEKGKVEWANTIFDRLIGRSHIEIVGVDIVSLLPLDDRGIFVRREMHPATLVVTDQFSFPQIYEFQQANHQKLILEIFGSRVQIEESNLGAILTIRDVTEQKQAEAALRQSEERNRLVLETANDAFITIDTRGLIIDWNHQAEVIFGWSREEIRGNVLVETIIPPQYREAHLKGLEHFHQSGEGPILYKRIEVSAIHRDGHEFPIEITVWPVRVGENHQFNAFVHDITERKRLEKESLQTQKMEAVGKFANAISHDFDKLLTAIIENAGLAVKVLDSGKSVRAELEEIMKAGKNASELTRRLLSFSQDQVTQPKIVDLNKLILGMDKIIASLLGGDIQLIMRLAQKLGMVEVGAEQMEKAIINLIRNARDAMPKEGKILIETSNVTLDERYVRQYGGIVAGDYVMLVITDTGKGMSEEVKAHLFEPFVTTKGKEKGIELGLATCHRIVTQANGYILVHSQLNSGTTVKIYLPRVSSK